MKTKILATAATLVLIASIGVSAQAQRADALCQTGDQIEAVDNESIGGGGGSYDVSVNN